jgi:hypothetical protein
VRKECADFIPIILLAFAGPHNISNVAWGCPGFMER